ncbi:MAG: 2-amino-4-hydroxy-6-hydroxymethyldihydropteridine diphosphokinase [Actinomycetota bacterium]
MRSWKIAVLALGGNLGDRGQTIATAIDQLAAQKKIRVLERSPLVESLALTPQGTDESKPNYLNGVIKIATQLRPKKLLKVITRIENLHGRIRVERWGSRTLDIDIITYEDQIKVSRRLTIPHPRAFQRAFVLVPWSMMDPDAILPGHGRVSELAAPMSNEVWLAK